MTQHNSFRLLSPSICLPQFAGRCALTVMAKAPAPGRVKTRLSPPLTPEQAAALNAEFLRDTMANLAAAAADTPAECVVSYTPEGDESAFEGILPQGTLLAPQRSGDFGERLLGAAEDLFACGFSAVCLIDSDSPTVPTAAFAEAARVLVEDAGGDRIVLGRSDDGGYYLIGMRAAHGRLFAEIAWSTDAVSTQTEARAAELGLPVHALTTWYDVDDHASLRRLQAEMRGDANVPRGYAAPHTRAFLERLQVAGGDRHAQKPG